jgi:ATP-binding cassette, subfamily B, bacterial
MIGSDIRLYRRFQPLVRPYRRRFGVALVASTGRPLFSAARIWLLKVLIDTVLRGRHHRLLWVVAASFVAIAVVRGLIVFWDDSLSGWVATQVTRDLRVKVYDHLQGLSLRYFHGQRLGDLLTRLSGDITAIEDLLVSGLSDMVAYVTTIVLFMALMVYLDAGLVLVALSVVPVLAATTVVAARKGRSAQLDIRARASELASTAEEGLSAIALVKAFARASYEGHRFGRASQASATARLRGVRVSAVFPPLADLVTAAGTAMVVFFGGRQVMAGRLSLGSLVAFLTYLSSLYVPIQGLASLISTIQRALVGAERLAEILDAPAALRERGGTAKLPPVAGEIEFSDVTFGYDQQRPVLRNINFSVSPGEMVALIGPTGAGKTTVVSLLLSYYHTDAGAVLLDGRSVSSFDPNSVREQVAAVLQEPMLFNTSVRENIRYGNLTATDDAVEAACRLAEADEFIRALPDGYDTIVGPRGSRLSGGQRQRLAIARALVKDAPVLILDEATSALDPATEAAVMGSLRAACTDRSVLVVAHRYSTVSYADRIVVVEAGQIVESGSQDVLLRRHKGAFREFVLTQTRSPTSRLPAL